MESRLIALEFEPELTAEVGDGDPVDVVDRLGRAQRRSMSSTGSAARSACSVDRIASTERSCPSGE